MGPFCDPTQTFGAKRGDPGVARLHVVRVVVGEIEWLIGEVPVESGGIHPVVFNGSRLTKPMTEGLTEFSDCAFVPTICFSSPFVKSSRWTLAFFTTFTGSLLPSLLFHDPSAAVGLNREPDAMLEVGAARVGMVPAIETLDTTAEFEELSSLKGLLIVQAPRPSVPATKMLSV